MPVADFLRQNFAAARYDRMRRSIERMVEGYDAADPERASIFALREEWMGGDRGAQARIVGGYGALVDYLAAECRRRGVAIRFGAVVSALDDAGGKIVARCTDGSAHEGSAAILTVPLPLLNEIALPPAAREKAKAAADIAFGNVIKLLLRFDSRWWVDARRELADLTFLLSEEKIPVWWTQQPDESPLLTGWFGGPKTTTLARLGEQALIESGLASLAAIFGRPVERLRPHLLAARAIDWAQDPFARGAYSYATTKTRGAQSALTRHEGSGIFFCGEALYQGRDMGTVEAALANGRDCARAMLQGM
jgi:monoamine oxidase